MKFYVVYAESAVENYVRPGPGINILRRGCLTSEFQYLTHDRLTVSISDEGGMEFPDFIQTGCIPLISQKFKAVLDNLQVDNLFYKPVRLSCPELGLQEDYWLALPPRIKCLDLERSQIEVEENEFLTKEELMRTAVKIVIDSSGVGNYRIFKLAEVTNQEIIVTEEAKEALKIAGLDNVNFIALEGIA